MSLEQLEVLFCRVVLFKFEIEDGNRPACIKDALVDACDHNASRGRVKGGGRGRES